MKNLYIKTLTIAFFILFTNKITANVVGNKLSKQLDSVEISLLTCSPHNQIYSLYGHTALRYQDKSQGVDIVINYGVFSFHKPHFIIRFVLGLTDYEMGIQNFPDFCNEYKGYGASVTQQVLNLTPYEKVDILNALQQNYEIGNRVYRYNYFYNNCTTKARDIILGCINGRIRYSNKEDSDVTFRKLIHKWNENHRWARFGNDMLLGVMSDRKISRTEQQFIPENLKQDFSNATIYTTNGKSRPLVKSTTILVEPIPCIIENDIFTPNVFFTTLSLFIIGIGLWETKKKKRIMIIDYTLLLCLFTVGLLLAIMVFSKHPTTNLNLQIIIFNPLAIFAIISLYKFRHKKESQKKLWIIMFVMYLIGYICSFIQTFAEGIQVLALSLLIKSICNYYNAIKSK